MGRFDPQTGRLSFGSRGRFDPQTASLGLMRRNGPSYDADAKAWFAAVAANGGQLYSSGYSEAVTKKAFNAFFVELKAQGLWSLLSELGVFGVGVGNLAAGMVKMKNLGTPLLTNNNFVAGDLTPSGASCGLKGDGSTKWININILASTLSDIDGSFGAYQTVPDTSLGNIRAIASTTTVALAGDNTNRFLGYLHSNSAAIFNNSVDKKGIIGVTRSGASAVIFNQYSSSSATVATTLETDGMALFRRYAGLAYGRMALSAFWTGKYIDSTNRAALTTALNNLHAAFGFTP